MAAETGFLIEGTVYEVPTLDSLTLDEEQLMYDRCGLVQEDFDSLDGETDEDFELRKGAMWRMPGLIVALMQIAYQRGNPDVKAEQIRLVIGKTKKVEAFSTLGPLDEEEPEVPLASTSEPNESSPSGSLDNDSSTKLSPASSGTDAMSGSGQEEDPAGSTGTTRSDTSSTSALASSAA